MSQTHCLGIDLGTSNSALAHANEESVATLEVTQVLSPNSIGEKHVLPSAVYIPNAQEFEAGSLALPWESDLNGCVVGAFAREHGAEVPDRLVTSAKSWLCHTHVNHKDPILPWHSAIKEDKVSAFDASRYYLEHIRNVYQSHGYTMDESYVVLTVPASFDEVARSLTHEAAEAAGLGQVTLLEEPQAAFYSWLDTVGDDWRKQVSPGDIVFVCDVGGGTSDFSLIAISESEGNLELERISVGEHILLGGDNVDLALAYALRQQMESEGKTIDDWQFHSLMHQSSQAKEILFEKTDLPEIPIAVPSRGSSLFGGTVSTVLKRELLHAIVLDGFLPLTSVDELPAQAQSSGLQEFGLNYASDASLSKHIAAFLKHSTENIRSNKELALKLSKHLGQDGVLIPDAILFNGGFFKASAAQDRIVELFQRWSDKDSIRVLEGGEHDLAVARGAAVYGRIKQTNKGLRIKAGTARSYYIGLETSMMAIPGFTPPVKALCVVPQGMEEGTECVLEDKEFGLVTGSNVRFRFFSSAVRAGDCVGSILPDALKELEETSTLETLLTPLDGEVSGETVPVKLHSRVTELGTLELWMQHTRSDQSWKLEFSVRTQ